MLFFGGKSRGGVEGRGGERFNEPCLRVFFLSGRGKDLRGLEGVRYPSKPLIFNSPKLGSFGGGGEGSGSTYFKKI
jgi:hypothetical protein